MEILFFLRGEKDRIQKFKNDLAAQSFPIKYLDEKNEVKERRVQIGVRTYEIVGIAFPEEYEADVMGAIQPLQTYHKISNRFTKLFSFFVRMMGLRKPLPEKEWRKVDIIPRDWIHSYCLGVKEDTKIEGYIEKSMNSIEKI